MINKDIVGLQILTIFKAKGLEFDTVLLLDRTKRKNSNKTNIIFEYDNIDLKNIYYKTKLKEHFDKQYAKAIKNEQDLERIDELNILYVALTRAVNNLIIFKKAKQSVFDILQNDFSTKQIGNIVITKNNLSNTTNTNISYTPIQLGQQSITKQDKIETTTNLKAKYFGIATHYCLEIMKTFDTASLEYCINIVRSKYYNFLDENDILDMKNRILILIKNTQFQKLISNCIYYKEQELIFDNELKIIDLLIKKDDGYIIIDYKTTIEQSQSHIAQVLYYKKAISDIVNTSKIQCYIVYLHKNSIEIVKKS
jgi:exodeoxyribonuclease V beta subunit